MWRVFLFRHWHIPPEKKENLFAVLNLTNKIFEILVTLLAIYLITELHSVPTPCRRLDCLSRYVEVGGGTQPDFFVRPCSEQREACKFSFANPELIAQARNAEGLLTEPFFEQYGPTIEYCACLLDDDEPIYCPFQGIRTFMFAYGILAVAFAEATATVRGLRSPLHRLIALVINILLFVIIFAYFAIQRHVCNSFDFRISYRVITATSGSSIIIVLLLAVAEAIAWHRTYEKAIYRSTLKRELRKKRAARRQRKREMRQAKAQKNANASDGNEARRAAALEPEYQPVRFRMSSESDDTAYLIDPGDAGDGDESSSHADRDGLRHRRKDRENRVTFSISDDFLSDFNRPTKLYYGNGTAEEWEYLAHKLHLREDGDDNGHDGDYYGDDGDDDDDYSDDDDDDDDEYMRGENDDLDEEVMKRHNSVVLGEGWNTKKKSGLW